MSDNKNIDRVFQEKFKDFETMPSDAVWDNIHESLHGKKKKRRIIPIWWQLGGVAAALLLLLTIGGGVFNNGPFDPSDTIVDTNEETTKTEPKKDSNNSKVNNSIKAANDNVTKSVDEVIKDAITNTKLTEANSNNNNSTTKNNTANIPLSNAQKPLNNTVAKSNINFNTQGNSTKTESVVKNNEELNKLIQNSKKKNTAITDIISKTQDSLPNSNSSEIIEETLPVTANNIEKAIAEANDNNTDEKEEEKFNRWSVSPNAAPVYFNTLGDGSSIHSQFNSNSKTGDINMSYGITGAYAINKRLKLRAGVNKVNLGYSTDNVIAYTTLPTDGAIPSSIAGQVINNTSRINNITYKSDALNTSYLSAPIISLDNVPEIIKTNPNTSLDQQFGFLEVPLEIEYKLIDKKLDVNLIGGFSTMFLTDNEIYAESEGNSTLIGEANNINDVSYSANFGIGLNYGVSEKININLEPMFKYQINTFSNTSGDFQPYFIGVYTGLSFKF